MKIHPVGTELFHADGQTDRHDETSSRFSQFCERAQKYSLYVCATTDSRLGVERIHPEICSMTILTPKYNFIHSTKCLENSSVLSGLHLLKAKQLELSRHKKEFSRKIQPHGEEPLVLRGKGVG